MEIKIMTIRPYQNKTVNELALIISNNKEDEKILLNARYELDLCWEISAKSMIDEIDKLLKDIDKSSETEKNDSSEFDDRYRQLGIDPVTKEPVIVRIGRKGPVAQIGNGDGGKRPTYATIRKGSNIDTITLQEVLELFKLPRVVGTTDNGEVIEANYGRFGPYLKHGGKFTPLKESSPEEVTLEEAVEIILAKEKYDAERIIKTFKDSNIQILNSHRGPVIWNGVKTKGRKSIAISKVFGEKDPLDITLEECENTISGKITSKDFKRELKTSFLQKPLKRSSNVAATVKTYKKYNTDDIATASTVFDESRVSLKEGEIGWKHPEDMSGEYEGFNNASMEHFGDPLKGFAREMTQNSLDAALNSEQPVVLNLKLHDIPINDIPNVDELKVNIQMALDTHLEMNSNPDVRVTKFFNNAVSLLNGKSLKVFEFSDFNTTGMSSGNKKTLDNTFYVYMKTKDFSQKSEDSLGSFGIGKSAPYAVSSLRTIFTSSVYSSDGIATQATQGKSILTTLKHKDNNGNYTLRNNDGYWGVKDGVTHINGYIDELSPYFQRIDRKESETHLGSKISVLGFSFYEDWKERMAYAIAQNFFASINNGNLIVNIGNNSEYTLDGSSIQNIGELIDPDVVAKHDDEFIENLKIRMSYLEAINGSVGSNSIEKNLSYLGKCRINLAVSEGLPKKVCFIRDGMYITDELSINKLKKFSEFNDFVVVFQCLNKKGNQLLREMEPPAHNTFETSRLRGDGWEGKRALNEVSTWIRDELKEYAYDKVEKTAFVNELEEFFNYELGEGGDGDDTINEINPFSNIIIKLKPTPKKKTRSKNIIKDGKSEDVEVLDPFGDGVMTPDHMGKGSGGGDMEGLSGTSIEKGRVEKLVSVKNFRFVKKNENSVRVFFDHSRSKTLKIDILLSGADEDMKLLILDSNLGEIHSGSLHVDVTANERNSIDITLNRYSYGSLKVEAHEI